METGKIAFKQIMSGLETDGASGSQGAIIGRADLLTEADVDGDGHFTFLSGCGWLLGLQAVF